MESFYYQYEAYPNSTSMLIQAGKTYSIEVLATFADGESFDCHGLDYRDVCTCNHNVFGPSDYEDGQLNLVSLERYMRSNHVWRNWSG